MKMMRLPWTNWDTPNGALDILRMCNARCSYCFNRSKTEVKPLALLEEELELLLKARNLHTLTISGGEPLLHPEILEVVRLGVRKNLHVSIMSNGILLDQNMAEELKSAGCEAVFLHIQRGQGRPDLPKEETDEQIRELRNQKAAILKKNQLICGLSLTIPRNDLKDLEFQLNQYKASENYEYLLLTITQDMKSLSDKSGQQDINSEPILRTLKSCGYKTFSFLGGKYHPEVPRWFAFHSAERLSKSGKSAAWHTFSPSLLEWYFMRHQRRKEGRYSFLTGTDEKLLKCRLLLNPLTGGNISALPFLFGGLIRKEHFRNKHIVMELPPYWLDEKRLENCGGCPDITIKDGKICPLCIADIQHQE